MVLCKEIISGAAGHKWVTDPRGVTGIILILTRMILFGTRILRTAGSICHGSYTPQNGRKRG